MKVCSNCKIEKELSEFYQQSDRNNGHSNCKECFNKYCQKRWVDRKIEFINLKGGGCKNCGYNKNYAALQFHHRDPSQKEMSWNKMRLKTKEVALAELEKCDLLCANCHAEIHNPEATF